MVFGALSSCPLCSSSLRYSSGMYRCQGYLSAWSKCSFSSTEPQRVKGKWKVPEDTENGYLSKVFKQPRLNVCVRERKIGNTDDHCGFFFLTVV